MHWGLYEIGKSSAERSPPRHTKGKLSGTNCCKCEGADHQIRLPIFFQWRTCFDLSDCVAAFARTAQRRRDYVGSDHRGGIFVGDWVW